LRNLNYTFENELVSTNAQLKLAFEELKTTQQNLIQSEKMASLGTLAAGISHEINNPLNFIHGGVNLINQYIKDNFPERIEEIQPIIEAINTGVNRTTKIINSLNHYNKSDTLPFSNCDLHAIMDDCIIMLHNLHKNRIEILKQYTKTPYKFMGNEGKLHQAFLNILTNAIQAIYDRGVITIFTDIRNDEFKIKITDNGQGITKEIIKNIFDPFFTTKDPGRGTGLGLSITYDIIQQHHGLIEFESQLGEGTKVLIILPLKVK
jgi:signal transduction histidine kinase